MWTRISISNFLCHGQLGNFELKMALQVHFWSFGSKIKPRNPWGSWSILTLLILPRPLPEVLVLGCPRDGISSFWPILSSVPKPNNSPSHLLTPIFLISVLYFAQNRSETHDLRDFKTNISFASSAWILIFLTIVKSMVFGQFFWVRQRVRRHQKTCFLRRIDFKT